MSETPVFGWFFQPPINGQPGLIMVVDMHPGPNSPHVPFVMERVGDVLIDVESHLPKDLHLFQHRIFMRDVAHLWAQIHVEAMPRHWRVVAPTVRQSELHELWLSREREDEAWSIH